MDAMSNMSLEIIKFFDALKNLSKTVLFGKVKFVL